jgi:hypothetical protein
VAFAWNAIARRDGRLACHVVSHIESGEIGNDGVFEKGLALN